LWNSLCVMTEHIILYIAPVPAFKSKYKKVYLTNLLPEKCNTFHIEFYYFN